MVALSEAFYITGRRLRLYTEHALYIGLEALSKEKCDGLIYGHVLSNPFLLYVSMVDPSFETRRKHPLFNFQLSFPETREKLVQWTKYAIWKLLSSNLGENLVADVIKKYSFNEERSIV